MALSDKKIEGRTPIKDFPDKYNGFITELINELDEKDRRILVLENEVRKLRQDMASMVANIRAEYENKYGAFVDSLQVEFENKMEQFQKKFVKKNNN